MFTDGSCNQIDLKAFFPFFSLELLLFFSNIPEPFTLISTYFYIGHLKSIVLYNNILCLLSGMAHWDLELTTPFKGNPCQKISARRCCLIARVWERPSQKGERMKYSGCRILYQLCHAVWMTRCRSDTDSDNVSSTTCRHPAESTEPLVLTASP